MPRTLITGGTGFVARHLEQHMHSLGYEVWRTSQTKQHDAEQRTVVMDVRSQGDVEAAFKAVSPDEVYHLAGISNVAWKNQRQYYDVNFTGTLNVLEAARTVEARVLIVSSAYVYGARSGSITEATPLSPANAYGASKAAAEMAGIAASKDGTHVVIARPFNHTGPGQSRAFFVPTVVHQLAEIAAGRGEPILKLGNLSAKRDMSDVRDVVRAYPALLQAGVSGEAYNVGAGIGWLMSDIVALAQRISDVAAEIALESTRKRASDVPELVADLSRLRETIDWTPQYDLERTIRDMLRAEIASPG